MENIDNFFSEKIKGKRIIVTGGTTGIGRSTVELLISLGGRVVTFGRDKEDLDKAIVEISAKYPNADLYGTTADVSESNDVERIFAMADEKLGGIDILVNNAGISANGITDYRPEEWRYVIETNLLGYMAFTDPAVKRMEKTGGHIINIGSMSAETREPTGTVYVTTKSAILGFTAALRKEVNPLGIKVSLIEPGAVATDMQPGSEKEHQAKIDKLEMLEAKDIALSILFCLCQPERCDVVTMQIRPFMQII